MIEFLLTSWWIYVPIVTVLLFFTFRNNQKIKHIKLKRELRSLSPEEQAIRLQELRRKQSKFDKQLSKYGVRGILDHIFPKK